MVIAFLIACQTNENRLSEQELLTRLSVDLRGYRPSIEEFSQLENGEFTIEEATETFLDSASFPQQIADLFAPIYDTRQDETLYPASEFGLNDEFGFAYSVGDEPLQLIKEVVASDLPWTSILTADWTMMNQELASVYPVEFTEEGDGWRRAKYLDGRPPAGVLMGNGLWWRYETSKNNASRARANQISRIFLCQDYLDKEISFDFSFDLEDENAFENAVQENASCHSCHVSLDPLASFLGGVFVPRKSGAQEMIYYHPEREGIWQMQTGIPPSYYGNQGRDLQDLAQLIAKDPLFVQCTVKQVTEHFWGIDGGIEEQQSFLSLRETFLAEDLNIKRLVKEIVSTPRYQSRNWEGNDGKEDSAKVISPTKLASQLEHLTGFSLQSGGYKLLLSQNIGFYDMIIVNDARVGMTALLLQEQLAGLATEYWFEQGELGFNWDKEFSKEELENQIANLHLQILSVSSTEQESKELREYFYLVEGKYDRKEGWKAVVRLILQDPRFLVY